MESFWSTWLGHILIIAITGLALLLVGFEVWQDFHQTISEDFLLLYFGVTSALAVGVWSTLVLSENIEKPSVFMTSVFFNVAAVSSLAAVVAGPGAARGPLVVSLTFLVVGIFWLFVHSAIYVLARDADATT